MSCLCLCSTICVRALCAVCCCAVRCVPCAVCRVLYAMCCMLLFVVLLLCVLCTLLCSMFCVLCSMLYVLCCALCYVALVFARWCITALCAVPCAVWMLSVGCYLVCVVCYCAVLYAIWSIAFALCCVLCAVCCCSSGCKEPACCLNETRQLTHRRHKTRQTGRQQLWSRHVHNNRSALDGGQSAKTAAGAVLRTASIGWRGISTVETTRHGILVNNNCSGKSVPCTR